VDFRAGDMPLIPRIVSDLSDYVNFRSYPGAQMGILDREDTAGQQICAHPSPREADGAKPQSGRATLLSKTTVESEKQRIKDDFEK